MSAVRGLVLGHQLSPARAGTAVRWLLSFGGVRPAPDPYLPRVWELRHNLSAYDALYVALAESLGADLITYDARTNGPSVGPPRPRGRARILKPPECLRRGQQAHRLVAWGGASAAPRWLLEVGFRSSGRAAVRTG